MAGTAERTDPELWERVKTEIRQGDRGGNSDQWSARKAQLAVAEYKKRGGCYKGRRSADNHLAQWTRQDWGTASGHPSSETHERYLPKKARETLRGSQYRRTTEKKQRDSAKGKQFSRQPKDVADKVAPMRSQHDDTGTTKHALLEAARTRDIHGRSRMSRDQLERALRA